MKFLCLECDEQMAFEERAVPGDGTFAAAFRCPSCGRTIAMLANPMETQLVESLGVQIGGRTLDEQPLELVRGTLVGRDDAFQDGQTDGRTDGRMDRKTVDWSADALERLARVPNFVRGMVKRIYGDWARERGIACITPEIMDQARQELGLEGM
jgi:Proto-chlorophyllide reductase 57 kD subunit